MERKNMKHAKFFILLLFFTVTANSRAQEPVPTEISGDYSVCQDCKTAILTTLPGRRWTPAVPDRGREWESAGLG